MNDENGWIKLSRKMVNSPYWLGEKFTRPMCWIDLLFLAEWRKSRTFKVRNKDVTILRGQLYASVRDLATRWLLSVNTVRNILKEMVSDGRIKMESPQTGSIITICNYDKYQCDGSHIHAEDEPAAAPAPSLASGTDEPELPEMEMVEVKGPDAPPPALPIIEAEPVEAEVVEAPAKRKKGREIDYDFIIRLYHDRCPSYPTIKKLTEKRKTKIRLRFEEMKYDYETLQTVFDKAEASRFMRGDSRKGWKADFDWIFENSDNWVKILEGKYDNPEQNNITPPNNGTNAIAISQPTNGCGPANLSSGQRQKLSVLATLAKVEHQHEEQRGNLTPSFGSQD